ncbi:DUF378 domain-containing protein [Bacillus sp. CECT 9360]|uniref:DUF378 domain-containing protein n=1 Tax=Bacillus sp. CECT 9360 TaxID=2845821 RepID=UPI001E4C026A|nr:DUF378 domain-containing protein [Bacillus sp. CECT 9360]CAH0346074.1 hypothetical protein BCI9360_02390 [Bacillus sp. CECT 9360]
MRTLNTIAMILLIVGGLNWLMVGLFQFDLVASIFGGEDAILSRIVYVVVGICALYALTFINSVGERDLVKSE